MHFSTDRTVHTTAFDKPVVDHWFERKIAQTAAGSTEKDQSDDLPLQRRARYRLSYIPLPTANQWRHEFEMKYLTHVDATGRKEGNVSFNDALNTLYLRLYGVR